MPNLRQARPPTVGDQTTPLEPPPLPGNGLRLEDERGRSVLTSLHYARDNAARPGPSLTGTGRSRHELLGVRSAVRASGVSNMAPTP